MSSLEWLYLRMDISHTVSLIKQTTHHNWDKNMEECGYERRDSGNPTTGLRVH
jgi:hypothetical protein